MERKRSTLDVLSCLFMMGVSRSAGVVVRPALEPGNSDWLRARLGQDPEVVATECKGIAR